MRQGATAAAWKIENGKYAWGDFTSPSARTRLAHTRPPQPRISNGWAPTPAGAPKTSPRNDGASETRNGSDVKKSGASSRPRQIGHSFPGGEAANRVVGNRSPRHGDWGPDGW